MANTFWLSDKEIVKQGFVRTTSERGWSKYFIPKDHPSGAEAFLSLAGEQRYITNDGYHNEAGPAEISIDGDVGYYIDGMMHRYEGPAMCFHDVSYYFIRGTHVKKEQYLPWLEEMGMDIDNLTPEDKLLIDLKWQK